MLTPREPVFVARDTYRRRRLIDMLRLLPVIGLLLFFSPLVGGSGYLRSTASSGLFLFAVWFALIGAAFVLVRLLAGAPAGSGTDPADPDPADPDPAMPDPAAPARAGPGTGPDRTPPPAA